MIDSIIITKHNSESSNSLYRRFTKMFRSSGIQSYTRKHRYLGKKLSKNLQKKDCLTKLEKKKKFEEAYRLGKIPSHTVYKRK